MKPAVYESGLPAKRSHSGKAFVGGMVVGAGGVLVGLPLLHAVFSLILAGAVAGGIMLLVALVIYFVAFRRR